MNLTHLKFVIEVERTKSFTKAARLCGISQPSLSAAIRQIEDQLGGKLFKRTTRSVSLTLFGQHMLPSILQITEAQAELKKIAQQFFQPQHKLMAIGFTPLADMRLINSIVNPYLAANDDVASFFKECFMNDLDARILDGQIDIGVRLKIGEGYEKIPGFKACYFYSEPVFVIPRDGNLKLLSNANPVQIADLAEETFVLTPDGCGHAPATRSWFKDSGHRLNEYQGQAVSYKVMQDWAALGLASAILPWSKITDTNRAIARRIVLPSGRFATADFEIIWAEGNSEIEPLRSFLNFFTEKFKPIILGLHVPNEKFFVHPRGIPTPNT